MLSRVVSFGLNGLDGYRVDVEADITNGIPCCDIVGLADAAVKESKERVRSAIKNSGLIYPMNNIVVNLAPADKKKEGTLYDLPIALSLLSASGQVVCDNLKDFVIVGELALDGRVRGVNGVLPIIISAKQQGITNFVIPYDNVGEASNIAGINAYAVQSLTQAVKFLGKELILQPVKCIDWEARRHTQTDNDIKYIKGQYSAKRAIEIAVAGGHNILLIGPPGAGKTMLARCIPSIMPDLTFEEALEIAKIQSVAGVLEEGFVYSRPFRCPHHTATTVALTGGGNKAKPGEISLAHNGVLFLDELPEYARQTLEALRQPIEDGVITVSRANATVSYPASFMLVASMNPCPCGNYGSSNATCTCSPSQIHKYLSKLSGPLLDRIDIHVEVDNITYEQLNDQTQETDSATVRERVNRARAVQKARFADSGHYCNARISSPELKKYCRLDERSQALIKEVFERLNLSARANNRILKVARTIADLDGSDNIRPQDVAEAIQYRSLDRKYRV